MSYLLSEEFETDEGAAYAAKKAREYAPVDTGYMKRNIRKYGKRVYAYADYSSYVNYGTTAMAARPFFTRGIEEGRKYERSLLQDLNAATRILTDAF